MLQEELFAPGPAGKTTATAAEQYAAERSERILTGADDLLQVQDAPTRKDTAERGGQMATLPASPTTVGTAAYLYQD